MEEQAEPANRVPEARELLTVAGWLLSAHGWKEEFVEKKRCYYDQDGKRIGGYKSLHKLLRRDPKLCADYFTYREQEQRKADAAAAAAATTKKAATKAPAKAKTVASTSKKVKAAGPSKPAKAQPKPAVLSSNRASSSSSSQQPKGRAELEDVILLDEEEEDDDEVDLGELGLTLEAFGEDPVLANAINTSRLVGELWRELMSYDNRLTNKGSVYCFKENGERTEVSPCPDISCSTDNPSHGLISLMSDGRVYVRVVQIGNALAMINFALARRELGYRPIILQFMYEKRVPFFAHHIDSLIEKERQRRRDKSGVKPAAPVAAKAAVTKGGMRGEAGVERSEDEEEEEEEGGENGDASNMPAPGTRMDMCQVSIRSADL